MTTVFGRTCAAASRAPAVSRRFGRPVPCSFAWLSSPPSCSPMESGSVFDASRPLSPEEEASTFAPRLIRCPMGKSSVKRGGRFSTGRPAPSEEASGRAASACSPCVRDSALLITVKCGLVFSADSSPPAVGRFSTKSSAKGSLFVVLSIRDSAAMRVLSLVDSRTSRLEGIFAGFERDESPTRLLCTSPDLYTRLVGWLSLSSRFAIVRFCCVYRSNQKGRSLLVSSQVR